MRTTKLASAILLTLGFALAQLSTIHTAQADIIVVAPTASTTGSLEITDDINFTITQGGLVRLFVFDDWVTSDGSRTNPALSPNFQFSINGVTHSNYGAIYDNQTPPGGGGISGDDGYLFSQLYFPVVAGDTVTLLAGTYTIAKVADFNQQATQTFTGEMFVTDLDQVRLSDNTPVSPAPPSVPDSGSTLLLLGSAALLVLIVRQRVLAA